MPYDGIDWNKARNLCAKEDLYYPHPFIQVVLHDVHPLSYVISAKISTQSIILNRCWVETLECMSFWTFIELCEAF